MWSDQVARFTILQIVVTGSSCFVNLAYTPAPKLQGTATMSEPPHISGWSADKVADGNTAQTAAGGSCAIMDFDQQYKSVWLKVLLGRLFNVAYIELYLRNEKLLGRSSGFSIYAHYDATFNSSSPDSNNLVYYHNPLSGCPAPIQNFTVNRLVKQIVFTNNRPDGFQTNCPGQNSSLYTSIELCEIKVMGCDWNRYGIGCTTTCPNKCKNQHCDAFNGSCADGCANPSALTADCILCGDRQYISNKKCVSCKGHCKNGAPCNKLTGQCDSGCTGLFCERFSEHFFGHDCNTPCGHCLNNDVCDNVTGRCPNGCQNHWTEDRCDVCGDQYYGSDCNTPCGHCRNNDVCNNVTGRCPRGCQNQWSGYRCDECEDCFYNETCTALCGFCANDQLCDERTGACLNGCRQHFKLPLCQECDDGFYNDSCTLQCGNCKAVTAYDQINGSCPDGCADLYEPPVCTVVSLFFEF